MNIPSIFISSLSIFPFLFLGGGRAWAGLFFTQLSKSITYPAKTTQNTQRATAPRHHLTCITACRKWWTQDPYSQQKQKTPHPVTWQGCTEVPLQTLGCKVHQAEAVLWASHQYQVMLALVHLHNANTCSCRSHTMLIPRHQAPEPGKAEAAASPTPTSILLHSY